MRMPSSRLDNEYCLTLFPCMLHRLGRAGAWSEHSRLRLRRHGSSAALGAKLAGVGKLIAVDMIESKAEIAK